MAAFDNEAYRDELSRELDDLKERYSVFPTDYYERRIRELSKRLGLAPGGTGDDD